MVHHMNLSKTLNCRQYLPTDFLHLTLKQGNNNGAEKPPNNGC